MTTTLSRLVGLRLRKFRKEKGFTQEELADKSGVERSAISKMELGQRMKLLDKLYSLTSVLGKRIIDLFQ